VASNPERTCRGCDVECERNDLRPLETQGRDEREIGQEAANRGPGSIRRVEQGNPPSAYMNVAPHHMSNQKRQGSTH
jgi:hypothetical protein